MNPHLIYSPQKDIIMFPPILFNKNLTSSAKLVFVLLQYLSNDSNNISISHKNIADQLGISIQLIEKAINNLIENEFIIQKQSLSNNENPKYYFTWNQKMEDWANTPGIFIHKQYIFGETTNSIKKEQIKFSKVGYIYFLLDDIGRIKIGKTTCLNKRIFDIGIKLPIQPKLFHSFKTSDITKSEQELHKKYKTYHLNGEWFNLPKEELISIKTL